MVPWWLKKLKSTLSNAAMKTEKAKKLLVIKYFQMCWVHNKYKYSHIDTQKEFYVYGINL